QSFPRSTTTPTCSASARVLRRPNTPRRSSRRGWGRSSTPAHATPNAWTRSTSSTPNNPVNRTGQDPRSTIKHSGDNPNEDLQMNIPSKATPGFLNDLGQADKPIYDAILREFERQEEGLELIASENYVSAAVLE